MIDCEIEKSPENGEEVLISSSTCKTEQFEPDDSDDYYEDGELIEEISCDIVQERCSKTAENRQECICGGTVFKDGRAYSGDDYVTYCNNLDNILLCGYFGNTLCFVIVFCLLKTCLVYSHLLHLQLVCAMLLQW